MLVPYPLTMTLLSKGPRDDGPPFGVQCNVRALDASTVYPQLVVNDQWGARRVFEPTGIAVPVGAFAVFAYRVSSSGVTLFVNNKPSQSFGGALYDRPTAGGDFGYRLATENPHSLCVGCAMIADASGGEVDFGGAGNAADPFGGDICAVDIVPGFQSDQTVRGHIDALHNRLEPTETDGWT